MNQLYEKKKIQTFKSYSIKKNKLRSYIFYFTAILTACILLVTLATYYQMSKESEKLIIDTQSSTLVNFGSVIDSMVLTNIENVALTVLSDDELYQKCSMNLCTATI